MDVSIFDAIPKEMYLVVVAMYGLGSFLKSTPKIPDWTIPFVLLVSSIVFSLLYFIARTGFSVDAIYNGLLNGIIIASMTVFGNQMVKQMSKRE